MVSYSSSKFIYFIIIGLIITSNSLSSCKGRVLDDLRPETVDFLMGQETARCACLDIHGAEFIKKMNKGIAYIKSLPSIYNMDSLSVAEMYAIKLELVSCMSIVKTVSSCIAEKTPPIDQFTGMLMQEDLRVVLQLDSTMTEAERSELINIPSMEMLEELCSKHQEAVLKLQELIKEAQILPLGLQ